MSKTSQSTNFRKVDVDELDEERFQDDAGETSSTTGPSESEIQNLLNSKKNTDALKLLLKSPPYGANQKDKAQAFALVLRVLMQYKTSEIDATMKQLSLADIDVLLKYLYRGFHEPTDSSCAALLNWHEKTVAAGGMGSIMRALTDRKYV